MSYTSTVVVTGASSGLGYETALQIARTRPDLRVVICSRTGGGIADKINSLTGHTNVVYLQLDLSTHAGTRAFAKSFTSHGFPPISVVVLNAGLQETDKVHMSSDGIELMFAVNHVNQALLFFCLRPHFLPTARVVIVASGMHSDKYRFSVDPHYTTAEAIAHPPNGKVYDTWKAGMKRYAESKLCNVLFAYALHDRSDLLVTALDPGSMSTGLYRNTPGLFGSVWRWTLSTRVAKWYLSDKYETDFSAATVTKMAIDPAFGSREKSGKYFVTVNAKEMRSSEQSYDKALQKDLWDWTIKEVAQGDEEAAWKAL